jgi:rhodanese-related sulfurtransferase
MIDAKEKITLVQVVDGEGWNYPHIQGAEIINKKHFETSSASLDPQKTNIFISKDGYDSAVSITKLINFGFAREKNLNLEGGLDSWRARGYSVEK